MPEPLNPVQVEEAIRNCVAVVAEGVRRFSEVHREYLNAERNYDLVYAKAYLRTDGPAHAKKYEAEVATTAERAQRDEAEVVYKYTERRLKAAEAELSAYQTLSRAVTAMYGAAGYDSGQGPR